MILNYKNTIYEPIYKVTNDTDGLRKNDFWINIDFKLKNEDIEFHETIPGMSFEELILWNKKNEEFLNGKMKSNDTIKFIRRIGELLYFPSKSIVEKKLYLYDDVNKYYSVFFTKDELLKIYENNKLFIEQQFNKIND